MAEKSYHKTAEERVKSIEKHLHNLQKSADHLLSVYHYCRECEHVDFSLSLVLPHERILPQRDSCLILNLTELDREYTAIPFTEQVCYTSFYPPGG